jgi:hypothetical protein
MRQGNHLVELDLVARRVVTEDHGHRGRLRIDRAAEVAGRLDVHERHADHPEGVVVRVPVRLLDDDLALHAGQVRELIDFLRVIASGDRAGGEAQGRRRPCRNERRLRAGQLGQPPADLSLQVVNPHELLRRFLHRLRHFRRHECAAESGERSVGIDERLHAQAGVERRVQRRRDAGGRRRGGRSRHKHRWRDGQARPEERAAGQLGACHHIPFVDVSGFYVTPVSPRSSFHSSWPAADGRGRGQPARRIR